MAIAKNVLDSIREIIDYERGLKSKIRVAP